MDHPIQGMMSRTGSFPLRVACELLRANAAPGSVVLDPFCGKGTSLFAARLLGWPANGLDVAPEAVACSKARMADVTLARVTDYVGSLDLRPKTELSAPRAVRTFFHPKTLRQIVAVRDLLLNDISSTDPASQAAASFTLGVLLGIFHGHATYSLSIPSAHAYSMAPNYVASYARKHSLKRPIRDVKECLLTKVKCLLSTPLPPFVPCQVRRGSAMRCSQVFPELLGAVDVIITSPPYLNAQTYAKDNWLRLWLLGYDHKHLRDDYLQTGSIHRYSSLMRDAFMEMRRMLKPHGMLICIAGDVVSRQAGIRKPFRTGTFLRRLCETDGLGYSIEASEIHRVLSRKRYFHALSTTNGHSKRDLVERVFVARAN